MGFHDTSHFGDCSLKVIVDDHVISNALAYRFLRGRFRQAAHDHGFIVAPATQSDLLVIARWRFNKNEDGRKVCGPDLLRALNVDFQDHVGSLGRSGNRRPVKVIKNFGPLQKTPGLQVRLEVRPVDEPICMGRLAHAPCPRGPASRQPKGWVGFDQCIDDRALPCAGRTRHHEDERLVRLQPTPIEGQYRTGRAG